MEIYDKINNINSAKPVPDPHDLYYSEKMETEIIKQTGTASNIVRIGTKSYKFTEMSPHGVQPLAEWDDMKLIATVDLNETRILIIEGEYPDKEGYDKIMGR